MEARALLALRKKREIIREIIVNEMEKESTNICQSSSGGGNEAKSLPALSGLWKMKEINKRFQFHQTTNLCSMHDCCFSFFGFSHNFF